MSGQVSPGGVRRFPSLSDNRLCPADDSDAPAGHWCNIRLLYRFPDDQLRLQQFPDRLMALLGVVDDLQQPAGADLA